MTVRKVDEMAEINIYDLNFGDIAESVFEQVYEEMFIGYVARDLSDIPFYRKMGVDYELTHKREAERLYVEVKHQRMINKTGCLFFETMNLYDNWYGKGWQDGWFNTSKADYIAFMESGLIGGEIKPIGFHYIDMKMLKRKLEMTDIKPIWINDDSQGYELTLDQIRKDFRNCYQYQDLSTKSLKIGNKKGLEATNY